MEPSAKNMDGCVMLALSTFRKSGGAVNKAMEKARNGNRLSIVFVVDIDIARYFIGAENEFFCELKERCESDLLRRHEQEGREYAEEIAGIASEAGIETEVHIEVGRFGAVCLDMALRLKPACIVTTRSKRPDWVKQFFGAPVDEVVSKAGCPVFIV